MLQYFAKDAQLYMIACAFKDQRPLVLWSSEYHEDPKGESEFTILSFDSFLAAWSQFISNIY